MPQVLKLHNNALGDIGELSYLQPLQALTRLTLMPNPLSMQRLSSLQLLALKHAAPEPGFVPDAFEFNALAYATRHSRLSSPLSSQLLSPVVSPHNQVPAPSARPAAAAAAARHDVRHQQGAHSGREYVRRAQSEEEDVERGRG